MASTGSALALEKGFDGTKRTALQLSGWPFFVLSFQTLGIIYADIGVSPLYVLNSLFSPKKPVPSTEDIIGGVSAVIWCITLLCLIKYIIISLYFGTGEGEGGAFALYQGLYPKEEADADDDRTLTGETLEKAPPPRTLKERARWPIMLACLLATALTVADGVFTPAISVTSAIEGIAIIKPSISGSVIPISIACLAILFLAQQFGTKKLASGFAPISFVWFTLLIGMGFYNLTWYPAILRAFDPSRAIMLFVRTRNYNLLSGVMLSITGCEAVFANLGQFNAGSIRLSFCGYVYPALILSYLGQGARLIRGREEILPNIFYRSIPGPRNGPLFWIVFSCAVLATLVASQALITATFSIFQQVINVKSIPPIKMRYTSETNQGQVYIPLVNWFLMTSTIIVIFAFSSAAALKYAYGFSLTTVMLITSVMIALHIPFVKGLPGYLGVAYILTFGFFDTLLWGAAIQKLPNGAWVPLLIGLFLATIMAFWTWAKELEEEFDKDKRMNLRHFIHQEYHSAHIGGDDDRDDGLAQVDYYFLPTGYSLSPEKSPDYRRLQVINTCAIFHKGSSGKGVPHGFISLLRQWPALPRVVIFLSISVTPQAHIPREQRYAVTKVRTVPGFYGVTYYIGFRDDFDIQTSFVIDKICGLERQFNPNVSSIIIDEIRKAAETITHIAPHYHVASKKVATSRLGKISCGIRRFFIEDVYRRALYMFPETENWSTTSEDEIIRVGVSAAI